MFYLLFFPIIIIVLFVLFFTFYLLKKNQYPTSKQIEVYQEKVTKQLDLKQWNIAAQDIQLLLKAKVVDIQTKYLKVRLLQGQQLHEESLVLIEEALKESPSHLGLYKEKGKALLELGNVNEALEAFIKAEQVLSFEEDLLDFSLAYYKSNQIKKAWSLLEPYLEKTNNGRLLAFAGDCQFLLNNFEYAMVLFNRAQKKGWSNHRLLSRLGRCYQKVGQTEQAIQLYSQILSYDSSNLSVTLSLGSCFEFQGLYERALMVYQGGRAWEISHSKLLEQAGICACHAGLFEFSELYLLEVIERGCITPEILSYLALSFEKQKKWREAEEVYHRMTKDYPSNPIGYRGLSWLFGVGLSETLSEEQGLAIAYYSLELEPEHNAWEILSACEARVGNFSRAHAIQEKLSSYSADHSTQLRRQYAMRTLRNRQPLDETLIVNELVA